MSDRKGLDWTRTGTVEAYAEWLRKKSDALLVLVVRPNDAVFAVDPACAADDAKELAIERVIDLARNVEAARKAKRPAARLELGELRE